MARRERHKMEIVDASWRRMEFPWRRRCCSLLRVGMVCMGNTFWLFVLYICIRLDVCCIGIGCNVVNNFVVSKTNRIKLIDLKIRGRTPDI